jgi:hypothetical protein
MNTLDVPIIQHSYNLFRSLHDLTPAIPKLARHTLWQRCQNLCLDILQGLISTGYLPPEKRAEKLLRLSESLDLLRVLIRLSFETKIISQKAYLSLQQAIDDIGRMLGGWLKSIRIGSGASRA